jgi:superoxide dismutase, Fe-Mn family
MIEPKEDFMPFTLPDLPYDYDALAPHVDEETMRLHHGKHHQTYVDKANVALEGTEWAERSVEEVLKHLDQIPEEKRQAVRNNAGGHYNHSRFWEWLSPDGGGEPAGALGAALEKTFGSFAEFQKQFSDAALAVFGSGWVWLVPSQSGLEIKSTPLQDSPLMEGVEPLLGLDVWEHAYYLAYQNRRADYVTAWWNVVNWPAVEREFQKGLA